MITLLLLLATAIRIAAGLTGQRVLLASFKAGAAVGSSLILAVPKGAMSAHERALREDLQGGLGEKEHTARGSDCWRLDDAYSRT